MPRRARFDTDGLSALSEMQDGLVARSQLERLGFPLSTAAQRCHAPGPWQRVLPGIVALHNGPLSLRQRLRAALLYAGPDSMLTGAAALPLYGIRRRLDVPHLHLLVPDGRQRTSSGFVVLERTIRLPTPEERQGLSCAPPQRAIFDAARRHGRADDVRALAAEAIQRGLTSPAAINRELREGQMRGSRLLRSAMSEVGAGVRSLAEADARRLVRHSPRLMGMWWNPRVTDGSGTFLLRPDGWLDEVALAWQIDSFEFHLSP